MSKMKLRELSPEELVLVVGGSGLVTKDLERVSAAPPEYFWPEWEDFRNDGVYDPWDDYGVGDNGQGSGGGDSPPSMTDMRGFIQNNSEFSELSNRLKSLILQSDKLSAAVYDLLKNGIVFEPTNGTAYFTGTAILVAADARAGANSSDAAINKFVHEVGHYVTGVVQGYNFSNPYDYARARAESEVKADMFMIEVSTELGITSYFTGTVSATAQNEIRNGTFDVADFNKEVNDNLLNSVGLAGAIANSPPPDFNGNGRADNTDLYLNSWLGPGGQTYGSWLQGQSGGGGSGGSGGSGGGGPGSGGGEPHFPQQNY